MSETMTGEMVQHSAEDFEKFTVAQLKTKRALVNKLMIGSLRNDPEMRDDPRQPGALAHYLAERKAINQALYQKLYGDDGPPAQVMKMDALGMAGQGKVPGKGRPQTERKPLNYYTGIKN